MILESPCSDGLTGAELRVKTFRLKACQLDRVGGLDSYYTCRQMLTVSRDPRFHNLAKSVLVNTPTIRRYFVLFGLWFRPPSATSFGFEQLKLWLFEEVVRAEDPNHLQQVGFLVIPPRFRVTDQVGEHCGKRNDGIDPLGTQDGDALLSSL